MFKIKKSNDVTLIVPHYLYGIRKLSMIEEICDIRVK